MTGKIVAVHQRKISNFEVNSETLMLNVRSAIPATAVLFDNGATLNFFKTDLGVSWAASLRTTRATSA